MIYVVDIFVLKRNLSSGINSCYLPSPTIIMRLCSQLNRMQSIFISFTLLSSYVFLFLPSLLLPSPLLFSSLISCSSINCSPLLMLILMLNSQNCFKQKTTRQPTYQLNDLPIHANIVM